MTDYELSQLRQDLMEQFHQMQADELPSGPQDRFFGDVEPEWAPQG
jgi:hypothetical protein